MPNLRNSVGCPRPLVMRCGQMGDMVLLTTIIRQLHLRFGEPVDVIASGGFTLPLLRHDPAVGEIVLLPSRSTPYWFSRPQQQLVSWLRRRGPGPTWFLDLNSGRDLLTRGGIPDSHVVDSRLIPWVPGEAFADRYIRIANFPLPDCPDAPPPVTDHVERAARLRVTLEARAQLDLWLAKQPFAGKRIVAIQAGNRRMARRFFSRKASGTKYWPADRWAEVVRGVRAHLPEHAILLLGMGNESAFNERILKLAGVSSVYNVAGELPMAMLLAFFEKTDSLISVDTGPAHAAAALNCPTVSLFGTANAELYRPGGATTPALAFTGTVNGRQDIMGIAVDQVLTGWKQLLRQHRVAAGLVAWFPFACDTAGMVVF